MRRLLRLAVAGFLSLPGAVSAQPSSGDHDEAIAIELMVLSRMQARINGAHDPNLIPFYENERGRRWTKVMENLVELCGPAVELREAHLRRIARERCGDRAKAVERIIPRTNERLRVERARIEQQLVFEAALQKLRDRERKRAAEPADGLKLSEIDEVIRAIEEARRDRARFRTRSLLGWDPHRVSTTITRRLRSMGRFWR